MITTLTPTVMLPNRAAPVSGLRGITPLIRLLRQAADTIERLELSDHHGLAQELRLSAVIEAAAQAECDRLGLERGEWWREGRPGLPIRRIAAQAGLTTGASLSGVARAMGVHHSTVLYWCRGVK